MKKLLLLVVAIGIGFYGMSQTKTLVKGLESVPGKYQMEPAPKTAPTAMNVNEENPNESRQVEGSREVSVISLGTSGNAYGFYGSSRTYVWADPNIGSVAFIHRMTGPGASVDGNGRLAIDVSIDGGETFTNDVQVYTPTGPGSSYAMNAGRYPQVAIINPEGNTDPANAFAAYFGCALDQTNDSWGSYCYGVNPLTALDPPAPTQTNVTSGGGVYRVIPDAYTVTPQGIAWYAGDNATYDGSSSHYQGSLIVGRGEMDESDNIVYEEDYIDFLDDTYKFNDTKVAFSPDGQTGYIVSLVDSEDDDIIYSSYHPVYLKTTDGGETWSDAIHIELGGVNGLEDIKYYWGDTAILTCDAYSEGFERDEVYYYMGYNTSIVIDAQNNPHFTGVVMIAAEGGIYPYYGKMASFHFYSLDGGDTWTAEAIYDNKTWRGDIESDFPETNRPYAAITYDGHYIFFSFNDTDYQEMEDNLKPDIYVIGYDTEDKVYSGDVQNVTYLVNTAWNEAWFGSMSHYVFSELDEANGMYNFEIPFVYTKFADESLDPAAEMTFHYIKGFNLQMVTGIDNIEAAKANFTVNQNRPNPAVNNTSIVVKSESKNPISLTVTNILGQVIHQESASNSAVVTKFDLNVSNYDSGIYFYTVTIGEQSVTKKMLVK